MYKILGGDGKEYGPVSTDTLRQWINQGRANMQTRVQAEGSTEWTILGSLPEFAALFSTQAAPGMAASSGVPAETSRMAIWSLVMGISAFLCILPAIPGLILGFMAMKDIRASNGRLGGNGLALAGTITSGVAILFIPIMAIMAGMLLPALAKAKSKAQNINCANNLKQLGLGVRMYSADNKDTYPTGTNWCDALMEYAGTPKVYRCPGDAAQGRSGYAFNAKLSGLEEGKFAPDTVMIFESDSGWNASGGKELMITRPRHGNMYVVGLADGSVQQVSPARLSQLRWDPKADAGSTDNK